MTWWEALVILIVALGANIVSWLSGYKAGKEINKEVNKDEID